MLEEALQDEKRAYEITVFSGDENFARVKDIIAKFGGEILDEKPQGKARLAYAFKKQPYAFLDFFRVKLAGTDVNSLSNELKLDDGILRFLIHTPRTEKDALTASQRAPRPAFRRVGISKPKSASAPTLTNEALEKKIEEILK